MQGKGQMGKPVKLNSSWKIFLMKSFKVMEWVKVGWVEAMQMEKSKRGIPLLSKGFGVMCSIVERQT